MTNEIKRGNIQVFLLPSFDRSHPETKPHCCFLHSDQAGVVEFKENYAFHLSSFASFYWIIMSMDTKDQN